MRASDAILKWLNKNRQTLGPYRNQYIACTAQGIIANGRDLQPVLDVAQRSGKAFAVYLVPRHAASIVLLPELTIGRFKEPPYCGEIRYFTCVSRNAPARR